MRYDNLEGKVALVTGASGGIGLKAAEMLAASGAHVVMNSRSAEKIAAAASGIAATSGRVETAVGDVADYASAVAVAEAASRIDGGIDILVSAGAQGSVRPMPFADMTGEQLVQAFQSRFFARINPVHAALPYLRVRGGSVVLVGTDAGRYPTPGESIVGAFGAGVIMMTKALAKEFARWRIPGERGFADTHLRHALLDRIFGEATFQTGLFSKALARFPSGRAPTADEVARVAVFLASEEAAQVTGQTVSVNGGLSYGGW